MADEGLWVALGQVADQLAVRGSWAIRCDRWCLDPVSRLIPLNVLRQGLGALKASPRESGICRNQVGEIMLAG